MIYSLSLIILCAFIYWFRSNAKAVFDIHWTPFQWWLYTSLITNYASLSAWWFLRDSYDIWKSTLIWQVTLFVVEVSLNSYFFGFNLKMAFSLSLIFIGILISLS